VCATGSWGVAAGDIDIATDAPPDRVKALAEDAGLRAVPTGEEHGTITIVADR
jgi:poly(A) polymerase